MNRTIKRTICALCALALLVAAALPSFAEGKVTYDGNAQDFIFAPGSEKSPTDLFDGLKGVMPGDSLVQKITVRNDISKDVKVNIYLRSTGAQKGSEELLSQLQMTVSKSDTNGMAYMFNATADQTDGLTDWVLLGTLYSGGEVDLEVKLDVPIELGDELQDAAGYIDWQFKVEELPVEPDDPKPPKTGDDTDFLKFALPAALSALVLLVLILVITKSRRSHREA